MVSLCFSLGECDLRCDDSLFVSLCFFFSCFNRSLDDCLTFLLGNLQFFLLFCKNLCLNRFLFFPFYFLDFERLSLFNSCKGQSLLDSSWVLSLLILFNFPHVVLEFLENHSSLSFLLLLKKRCFLPRLLVGKSNCLQDLFLRNGLWNCGLNMLDWSNCFDFSDRLLWSTGRSLLHDDCHIYLSLPVFELRSSLLSDGLNNLLNVLLGCSDGRVLVSFEGLSNLLLDLTGSVRSHSFVGCNIHFLNSSLIWRNVMRNVVRDIRSNVSSLIKLSNHCLVCRDILWDINGYISRCIMTDINRKVLSNKRMIRSLVVGHIGCGINFGSLILRFIGSFSTVLHLPILNVHILTVICCCQMMGVWWLVKGLCSIFGGVSCSIDTGVMGHVGSVVGVCLSCCTIWDDNLDWGVAFSSNFLNCWLNGAQNVFDHILKISTCLLSIILNFKTRLVLGLCVIGSNRCCSVMRDIMCNNFLWGAQKWGW